MNNNILIFGNGYIGTKLQKALDCNITDVRIDKIGDVEKEVKKYNPKIIINCIGYTGIPNVDNCEENRDETLQSNVYIPLLMGEVAFRNNIKLVHISSGCIYEYDYGLGRPIKESDIPDYYKLFYSRTKSYCESIFNFLDKACDILTLRIRIPLDNAPHRKNLLDKLISYNKVIDAVNSITYVPDFIEATKHLIEIGANGTYNVANDGGLYFPDLLDEYIKYNPDFKYTVISPSDLDMDRTNLILSVDKLKASGFPIRPIKDVIPECVYEYMKNKVIK